MWQWCFARGNCGVRGSCEGWEYCDHHANYSTERAKSPPLQKQDEIDDDLSTESSTEAAADVSILEDFAGTGDFRPGIDCRYSGTSLKATPDVRTPLYRGYFAGSQMHSSMMATLEGPYVLSSKFLPRMGWCIHYSPSFP